MRNRLFISLVLILWFSQSSHAQEPLLINTYNRNSTSLNGEWNYIVDPYENGYYNFHMVPFEEMDPPWKSAFFLNSKVENESELLEYNFDKAGTLTVPGDWNTQQENLYYYEGTIWYKKSFDYAVKEGKRVFVYFGAANYQSDVYVNGQKLGRHLGGFTPFNYEITDLIRESDNFLIVKVNNTRKKEAVPTVNTDWWNYGGLTRDVKLIETPETYIQDYFIQLDPEDPGRIKGFVQLSGTAPGEQTLTISIPELKISQVIETDEEGKANIEIRKKKMSYWSPGNPKLYEVTLKTASDEIKDQIGFRTVGTQGSQILINDEPVFLKGICIHEEEPFAPGGRANSPEDARQLLAWVQEMGGNYVRLSHYPHNEHIIRLADEMGILVWEENPVYWAIQWENTSTFQNARNQLTEVINRDRNRASVIIWSMANETPQSEARNRFLTDLAKHTRQLDPTRLISAALLKTSVPGKELTFTIKDPFADVVDVLSFNQYTGWYDGLPEKCRTISWEIPKDKPVLVSEFGGGAKQGYYGTKLTRWTEEYQEYLFQENLAMLDRIEGLAGMSPWLLKDFRSPRRPLVGIQDGWNRKGLISETGQKKKAFFVLQSYYRSKGE